MKSYRLESFECPICAGSLCVSIERSGGARRVFYWCNGRCRTAFTPTGSDASLVRAAGQTGETQMSLFGGIR